MIEWYFLLTLAPKYFEMNKFDKKKQAYALVNFLFEPGSDKSVLKNDLKKLILSCGYSEPVEELFHKCWNQSDYLTGSYFSVDTGNIAAFDAFNSLMTVISFIDLSTLKEV